MSFSLIYICCSLILFPFLLLFFYIVPYPSFSSMSFHWSISAVVSGEAFYLLFTHCSHMFQTHREPGSALVSFPIFSSSLFSSFSSILFLTLPFLLCLFHWSISAVASGEAFYLSTVALCFWPAGNLECPCLFSDLILFPFSPPFLLYCSLPFFSSMSFSLIYICCSLILFPFSSLFFYIVPYPSFFFHVFFIDLYLL